MGRLVKVLKQPIRRPIVTAFVIWFVHFMVSWGASEIWPREWTSNAVAWGATAIALLAVGMHYVRLTAQHAVGGRPSEDLIAASPDSSGSGRSSPDHQSESPVTSLRCRSATRMRAGEYGPNRWPPRPTQTWSINAIVCAGQGPILPKGDNSP